MPRWIPAARRAARAPAALALIACAALSAAVLLPGLGAPGLWEPQERAAAERLAPPRGAGAAEAPAREVAGPSADACPRAAPADALARSLTGRALRAGRDAVADTDGGRRLPLALLGLVCALATAAAALRLGGPRAAVATGIALLAMPLLVLQARMLTSEIGTAAGGALAIYGLVALAHPPRGWARRAADSALAAAALASGIALGFLGGGALLGVVVPLGAFAAAAASGLPAARRGAAADGAPASGVPRRVVWVGAAAAVAAAALLAGLAAQVYELADPVPGLVPPARQLLGRAIAPEGCWSWALGATWRPDDDLRMSFDSTLEQIGYGAFPFGALAPIAAVALLRDGDPRRRLAGALALAWAGAAWVAAEAFQRKVGPTLWAGFPALALAAGTWLDGQVRGGSPSGRTAGGAVAALFAVAVIALGKDMYSFAGRVAALLVGGEGVAYPEGARAAGLPLRLWPLVLGALIAGALAVALTARDRRRAAAAASAALAVATAAGAMWAFAWQPVLARHLSPKALFETYHALRGPADRLLLLGDLAPAARDYGGAAGAALERVATRADLVAALRAPARAFAIAPQSELCALHRELGGQPYFVLEERNLQHLLISNRLDGGVDRNPLAAVILLREPAPIAARPRARVVFDQRIELLGWSVPRAARRGDPVAITLYFKVLAPVGASWRVLAHFDGPAGRAGNGDHEPIGGRCSTAVWQPGDYIVDRFTAAPGSGAYPAGPIHVWVGFFTGSAPSFRNLPISEAPPELRDAHDRVRIAPLLLE